MCWCERKDFSDLHGHLNWCTCGKAYRNNGTPVPEYDGEEGTNKILKRKENEFSQTY